ncbi:MAG TPA: type II CAAX endopeptidase family protein [Nostocaceae cyanobacterium]|nr:type II CAAX endopeptidase family protein [Nostocaceae cyanobacterium]
MTLKRFLLLFVLTPVVVLSSAFSLFVSWQKPQFQNNLELYQTNIVLQALAWQPEDQDGENVAAIRKSILGENPLQDATEQYNKAFISVKTSLDKAKQELGKLRSQDITAVTPPKPLPSDPIETKVSKLDQQKQLQQTVTQQQKLLSKLDLRLGILQAKQGQTDQALQTWEKLEKISNSTPNPDLIETARVLSGLWSSPPRLLPNAQKLIQNNLEGWFRSTALIQLYQLQQRQDAVLGIQAAQQEAAAEALLKFVIIGTVPTFTAFVGLLLLVFLLGQRLVKGKEALLAQNADRTWSTPWDGETILQVFVLGFFFMGQLLVPEILALLPIKHSSSNIRFEAFYILVTYLLVAAGALSVLYVSIKRFFPLPEGWFRLSLRGKWFWWGVGGYCTALPIVIIVSLVNQKLWQGQGGSNPLLQLALESKDSIALGIFFFTAAIAAPLFEELLFRGFLLPSLTRYLSVGGAIFASSLLFAAAHLSLSEIIPLTALGMVLGTVYTRSRNLLAPMLLHSLWNSGTLLSLFLLGTSNN